MRGVTRLPSCATHDSIPCIPPVCLLYSSFLPKGHSRPRPLPVMSSTVFWLYLPSTLGWVQNSNLNLGLEPDAGLGTISPRVVSYSPLRAWARAWGGWRWSWVGRSGGGACAGGGAVGCWMNCGISVFGGSRILSGCCGLMACGGCGGAVALASSVAGCSRAACTFCSCRCHRERWQQGGRFFMRTIIPSLLGL